MARGNNAFIPVRAPAGSHLTASHCTPTYPCLSPVAYPLETITPILNLRQADYWQPDTTQDYGWALRGWLYLATITGWAATTLAIAAFTGLARKD